MDRNAALSSRTRRDDEDRKLPVAADRSRHLASIHSVSRNLFALLSKIGKSRLTVAVVVGLLAAVLLMGILRRPILTPSIFASFMDYHYGVVFGDARKLQLGIDPSQIRFNFGLLSAFVASWIARALSFSSIGDWMRMCQAFQCVFFIFTVLSAWCVGKGDCRLILLVTVAIFPWIHTTGSAILAPNQSGFRFLTFPLIPIIICLMAKLRGFAMLLVAAAFSGFCLLWNPETGLACLSAFGFYILVRVYLDHRDQRWQSVCATALFGAIALVFALVGKCSLVGCFPQSDHALDHMVGILDGYGGLRLARDSMVAALAALLASFLVIFCCSEAASGKASIGTIERAAIAVAALVWFAYYTWRPAFWNLWTILLLLSFTGLPLIRARLTKQSLAIWVFTAGIVSYSYYYWYSFLRAPFVVGPPVLQGIITSDSYAKFVLAQSNHLRDADRKTVFFSSAPFTLSIESDRVNETSVFDPFAETWTPEAYSALMSQIHSLRTSCILIEAETSPALDEYRRMFFARVQSDLAGRLEFLGVHSGWNVFRMKKSDARC